MDNRERELLDAALSLLHQLIGYADAKADFKPLLRFVESDPTVIPFPRKENTPSVERQEANFLPKKENDGALPSKKEESGVIFTEKEILQMPKKYQKTFKTNKAIAHVRLVKGKYYEIRVMIDGVTITASSKNLERAKEKFIQKLYAPKQKKQTPLFRTFVDEWLENVARPFIKETTYNDYNMTISNHLIPSFGLKRLHEIDSLELQKFLNEKGSSRTTEKCFTLLSTIFAYAAPKYIPYSPMQYVKKPIYNPKEKKPLSKEEEFSFIRYLFETQNPYRYHFTVILYTGLRRSELKTIVFEKNFVTVLCAKQRYGRPEKLRSIPISPILKKFLPIPTLTTVRDDTLSAVFKEINDALGMNHTLHDLRKTFNTRARTCGIPKLLAMHWMGHKPNKDDVNESAYMDYSEEYQIEEIKKFDYALPDDILPKFYPKIE